ncbi:DsbA family oxidoreductase [Paenibacillus oenotherae]|uniref:DsbA family oxidoreductase n=1 Tax=Paenibacillus oenotherae TaxID=1435645 RepID=A0ABS7D6I4_9BACL|nr:DsbA family oxidoreductase [Paenibacillus oenotherae]MBW7475116.1 DsbA family oxidoreductase [Paenibacillus oenotherae]
MRIDLYSDMVCPWCRIGKHNLYRALKLWEEKGGEPATVHYHAYQLDPQLPAEGRPFEEVMLRKTGGDIARLQGMQEQVAQAGAAVGITFRFDLVERMPNTRLAHRMVALLPEEKRADAVEALFRANFEEGRDIAQWSELTAIAADLGEDADRLSAQLEEGGGNEAVDADLAQAAQIGITGVPFFVFNNQYALSGAYPAEKLVELLERAARKD